MEIVFDVVHAFHPESNLEGTADVRRILHDCLVQLNHAPSTSGINSARYWINGRCVVWDLPHVFSLTSTADQNAYALRCLLDCLIDINSSYLKYDIGIIPKLYDSGVRYKRTQIWDTIPALYNRRFGDCKSLTAALVAQYRKEGIDCAPVFRWQQRQDGTGSLDYHILVQTENGFEDPSKILGMGKDEVAPIRGLR